MIAFKAAGDDVFPGFASSFYNGNYVVKGEIFGGALFPAILTGVVVSRIYVGSAKLNVLKLFSDLYIFQKPENAGHLDPKTDAPDLPVVFRQNFAFSLVEQGKRSFPGNDVYRFVGCV